MIATSINIYSEYCKNWFLILSKSHVLTYQYVRCRLSLLKIKSNSWIIQSIRPNIILFNLRNVIKWQIYAIFILHIFYCLEVIGSSNSNALPRFVSIKVSETNARSGPSMKSSIDWIFISKGEPVEVIEEYDQWRLVKDIDGDGGWVHSSVLSSRRSVIVTGVNAVNMFKKPSENSQIVATVYPKVRCHLNKCLNSWCYVKCKTYEGWIINSNLWGIYTKDTSKVASKTSGEQGARTIRTIVRKQSSQLSHPSTLHF